jgi:hypothetical protein
MDTTEEIWVPGSFTKNFSWGSKAPGLSELYNAIRRGFDDKLEDVPRELFRERLAKIGRPDLIPINFFLFNYIKDRKSYLCADELVFQALSWEHTPAFDKLGLFAFLISLVGVWKGASKEQRRPALWAKAYVVERLAPQLSWRAERISADDIQKFVSNDPRYRAETSRKLSTNLNFLFEKGGVSGFSEPTLSRWWNDCIFLALDRLSEDAMIDGVVVGQSQLHSLLYKSGAMAITGGRSSEKDLAIKHLLRLYVQLGGRRRLSEEYVTSKLAEELEEQTPPNSQEPHGAVHRTNPRILKSIPSTCIELARRAGFDVLTPLELEQFSSVVYSQHKVAAAVAMLQDKGIESTMTADELLKITRSR